MTLSSDISTTSTALSDIKSAIIAKGVTPSGNITTYATAISQISGGGSSSKYGATINSFLGDVNANNVLQAPTEEFDLSFTSVTDIADYVLSYKFNRTKVKSVSFPALTTLSGISGLAYAFYNCPVLTSVSFPELTTLSGVTCMNYMLSACQALTSVSFPKLTTITGGSSLTRILSSCPVLTSVSFPKLATLTGSGALSYAFYSCTKIESISFPALTTTSFDSKIDQFTGMMSGTGTTTTHTIHFPSNMQSTISGLTGYPNFGGTSGYVTLSFDLPATS